MSVNKRFVIKKDAKTDVITYMEYEKLKGLKFKPKSNMSFDDMISVNEMIVINPSLIEKLISKKCSRTFKKIIKMISLVSDDDDDDSGYMLILDEMERFRNLIINKYKNYMEEKEYDTLLKKLEILKQEVESRRNQILELFSYENSKRGKSSR